MFIGENAKQLGLWATEGRDPVVDQGAIKDKLMQKDPFTVLKVNGELALVVCLNLAQIMKLRLFLL